MIISKNELNATDEIPRAANIPSTIDAWIGSDSVLTFDNDGKAHPSTPTPAIATGSGSGSTFLLLKNDRDDDFDDTVHTILACFICNLV